MRERCRWVMVFSVLVAACGSPPPIHRSWWAPDGESFEADPYVRGRSDQIDGSQLSLRTWPELQSVAAAVVVEPDESSSIAHLIPSEPLSARWYAIRCAPDPGVDLAGGVPLSDGSYVWRFFGDPFPPEVVRVLYPDSSVPRIDVQVEFSTVVQPATGFTAEDVATVTQGSVECSPWIAGDSIGSILYLRCSPVVDWDAPFRLQLQGLESLVDGDPLAPFDLMIDVAPGAAREIVLSTTRPPAPLVPAGLCADVECE